MTAPAPERAESFLVVVFPADPDRGDEPGRPSHLRPAARLTERASAPDCAAGRRHSRRPGSSPGRVGLVAERLERLFDPPWQGWRAWLAALGLAAAVTAWAGVVAGLLVGP